MARLAERYTVVAPDLLGHGRSAKPRGDYSLGAYASGARDLLGVLGFERGNGGRPLPGRRDRTPVRLPVPRVQRAARARLQRRARQGGPPVAARGRASGRRARDAADHPRLGDRRRLGGGRSSGPPGTLGRARPRRGGARLRLTCRARRTRGVPSHAASRRRSRRSAGQRHRPPLSGREAAHPADLGHRRPDHPDRARPRHASSDPRKPPGRDSPAPGIGRSSTIPIASSPSSQSSSRPRSPTRSISSGCGRCCGGGLRQLAKPLGLATA